MSDVAIHNPMTTPEPGTLRVRVTLLLSLAALLVGCPSREPLQVTDIAPLDNALLVVDESQGRARVLQLGDGASAHLDLEVGQGPVTLLRRDPSEGEALVFSAGVPAEEDEEGSLAELSRVAHDGLRDFEGRVVDGLGEADRWRFSDQYASVRLAGEQRYAMAFEPLGRLVVDNRVEIADLEASPSPSNPVALSLRSLGGESPTDVAISRPLSIGSQPLRVVALLATGQLSLFDLDAPSVPPITVPTHGVPGRAGPKPVEAVFVGNRIVVRTDAGDQLLVISLIEADGSSGGQRFDVSISTLLTAQPVRRLLVDERASSPRLLALSGYALHVFDLAAGLRQTVNLPFAHSELLPFVGTAPGDPLVRDRLALYGPSAGITFVDFGDGPLDVRGVFDLVLDFVPTELSADAEATQLVAFRRGTGSRLELDVAQSRQRTPGALIDLSDRSATPLSTTGIDRSVMSHAFDTLWVADAEGYVSHFNTRTLTQAEGWLGVSVELLLPLTGDEGLVLAFSDLERGTFHVLEPGVEEVGAARRVRAAF